MKVLYRLVTKITHPENLTVAIDRRGTLSPLDSSSCYHSLYEINTKQLFKNTRLLIEFRMSLYLISSFFLFSIPHFHWSIYFYIFRSRQRKCLLHAYSYLPMFCCSKSFAGSSTVNFLK